MKIAVIGTGSWGKNLVRNFYELGVLKIVCDLEEDNLIKARERYPNLLTTSSLIDVIDY